MGVSREPEFAFERLGVRIPTVLVSPWITARTVINEPNEEQVSGEPGSRWEHSSVASSIKRLFNLPNFLTKRDAWAAHFESTIVTEDKPRTDCPLELTTPLTDELLNQCEQYGNISNDALSDLQYEIL